MTTTPIEPATERFRRHLGREASQRVVPSAGRAIGAAGAVLAGGGVAFLGADAVAGEVSRTVAIGAAATYATAGWWAVGRPAPALRAAGATALTIAVVLAFSFAILTEGRVRPRDPALVLALSSVAWGTLYVVGRGRGHPVFLGAALTGVWLTIAVQIGIDTLVVTLDALDTSRIEGTRPVGVGAVSLGAGAIYVGAGAVLDRVRLHGTATPCFGVGIVALAVGVLQLADRGAELLGALLVGTGLVVAAAGVAASRRLSLHLGTAVVAAGATLLVISLDLVGGRPATATALAVLGVVAVRVAHALDATDRDEVPETGRGERRGRSRRL